MILYIPIRLAKMKWPRQEIPSVGCGAMKLSSRAGRSVSWCSLENYLLVSTNCDTAILPNTCQIKMYQTEMNPFINQNKHWPPHSSVICHRCKPETTQMHINSGMDKYIVVCTSIQRMLQSSENEHSTSTQSNNGWLSRAQFWGRKARHERGCTVWHY